MLIIKDLKFKNIYIYVALLQSLEFSSLSWLKEKHKSLAAEKLKGRSPAGLDLMSGALLNMI